MPLHMSPLVSRRELDHPHEKAPVKPTPLNYERVLKYNPNHDPASGRFSSGGGGRQGGTAGAPTEDAFGSPLKGRKKPKEEYSPISGRMAPVITHDEWVKGAHGRIAPTQRQFDSGFTRGTPAPSVDPHFSRGGSGKSIDPHFNVENAAGPGFQFSAEQKARNYKEMFGTAHGGSGGYKAPLPHGPYDLVKAKPGSSTRYQLVPHNPRNDPPQTRGDSNWVLELAREASKGIPGDKLNTKANRATMDKNVKARATAMAKGITSWEEAHTRANEAEFENYHEVAAILRARAKRLKH